MVYNLELIKYTIIKHPPLPTEMTFMPKHLG